ncbi:MAG: hypothetical protein AAGA58_17135 [Verrucomicrobiota bacterium]
MPSAPNVAKGTPGKFLLVFTILMAGVGWTALSDRLQRKDLETTEFPTAIADESYLPAPESTSVAVATISGEDLFPTSLETRGIRDGFMVKAVDATGEYIRDDTDRFHLYRETPDPSEPNAPPRLFFKTDRNRYLEVTDQPADTPPASDA